MNFLQTPQQSLLLQQENIPPPGAISDAAALAPAEPAIKKSRREVASKYVAIVKLKNSESLATPTDVQEAHLYAHGIATLDMLPSIQRVIPGIQAAEIVAALQPQFDAINARLDATNVRLDAASSQFEAAFAQISARQLNAFLDRDIDSINPVNAIPIDGNPVLVPADFPRTRGELHSLNSATLNILLTYYQLPFRDVSIDNKKSLLAAHLGLPPRR